MPIQLLLSFLPLLACNGPADPPAKVSSAPVDAPVTTSPRRNALLIVIDTLRDDALTRAATPNIDALAAKGQRLTRAWSAGTWTVPSVISLFTGMPIRQHGWDLPTGKLGNYPALPATPMLAEHLQAAGFTTDGLYSNGYLAEELGFDRGFDSWYRVSDKIMAQRFKKVVDQRWTPEGRNFAYLHLLGPHSPLKPSDAARERYQLPERWFTEHRAGMEIGVAKRNQDPDARPAYTEAYHAVIEDTDLIIGDILAALGPHASDTLVVITSDHGELLGEHKIFGHGHHVYEGLTQVPYVTSGAPELPELMSTSATPAVISAGLGLDNPWAVQPDTLPLVAQREGKLAMSADGRIKATWTPELAVYDLEADPREDAPLSEQHGALELRAQWEAAVPKAGKLKEGVELSEGTKEQLEALGYVE